ncbi:Rtt107p NDAI_0C03230 [Naumovozyma dairenensis CBS 421]|uniref:BRCT domain-containing protein n=1 Tax=Naumovozyma dairenensis (strain ATCC 10597 / BCRC 20456 / CBS 421 / NBRC 0211 / NRRL Y-12639) TaxID=1071378 RepID=G0W872_NAUDC|nr:hypothetical protein NDAI_0C03230 [Naumovozyma dairenensis CBS 421]CCD23983.1 hypothetical protein NDAI_0C03230 [Naumovozyma dairenensis CBS 421]
MDQGITTSIKSKLFENLNFLVIATENDDINETTKVVTLLEDNGCNSCLIHDTKDESTTNELTSSKDLKKWYIKTFGSKNIHFIISNTSNFRFYKIAEFDFLVPIVTPKWVTACISTRRHLRTSLFSPNPNHFFRNFQICISTYSMKFSEYIFYSELINSLGGTITHVINNKTTHLIAIAIDDPAIIAIKEKGQNNTIIKSVYPTWLVQCFKERKYIDESPHLITEDQNNSEHLDDIWRFVLDDVVFSDSIKYQFLKNKRFILAMNLSMNKNTYSFFLQLIKNCGGSIVRYIEESDIETCDGNCYIGDKIGTKDYELSLSKGNVELGNLIWFFHMWSICEFVPPNTNLLFEPFKKKIFKSSELILTYTNYFGRQRSYIQRLTEMLGGISTTELSKRNTHLVSRMPVGKKFFQAKKWKDRCQVINHLWLERTYKTGIKQDPNSSEFQDFKIDEDDILLTLGQYNYKLKQLEDLQALKADDIMNSNNGDMTPIKNDDDNEDYIDTILSPPIKSISVSITATEANKKLLTSFEGISRGDVIDNQLKDEMVASKELSNKGKRSIETSANYLKEEIRKNNDDEDKSSTQHKYEKALFDNIKEAKNGVNEVIQQQKEPTPVQCTAQDIEEETKLNINVHAAKEAENTRTLKSNEIVLKQDYSHLFDGLSQEDNDKDQLLRTNAITTTPNISRHSSKLKTPTAIESNRSRSFDTSIVASTDSSGGSGRRAARAKAEKRLHESIESLNEFEKNSKKKRIGNLLPAEIAILEEKKQNEKLAKEIVSKLRRDGERENVLQFSINAISTGCHEDIGILDLEILNQFGIRLYPEITSDINFNTVIAPKKMRTAKFLKSFSFHPLKNILLSTFIDDILKNIHIGNNDFFQGITLNDYKLKEFDNSLIEKKTRQPTKLFERAGIVTINLMNDLIGGTEIISSILKCHGIKHTNVINHKKFGISDIVENKYDNTNDEGNNTGKKRKTTKKRIRLNDGKFIDCPNYVIVATKPLQAKKLKKIMNADEELSNKNVLIVDWDWCVNMIFNLRC